MYKERDPHTSYRIDVTWLSSADLLTFSVTIYPPATQENSPTIGRVYRYREDVIPEWMRVAVDMIDMAALEGVAEIPHFGNRSGTVYWLFAQQVYEKDM